VLSTISAIAQKETEQQESQKRHKWSPLILILLPNLFTIGAVVGLIGGVKVYITSLVAVIQIQARRRVGLGLVSFD
jgi:hypothetical protein